MTCNLFEMVFIPNKKNYLIYVDNNDIKLSTPKLNVPFGIEKYNYKYIANLELGDGADKFHNTLLNIDKFFMRMSSDRNFIKKFNNINMSIRDLFRKIYGKTYISCIKNRHGHPSLLRTYIKDPNVYCDIKGMSGNFKLHLSTLWISKYNYGLIYYMNDME